MQVTLQTDDLDRGAAKVAPGEQRFCALTRTEKPVEEMIRFVVGPDSQVVPDVKRKLPGRGLWITGHRPAIAEAVARNIFARGFKRDLRADPALPDLVERLLEQAALDALAIAAKSGRVVAGFGKVEDATADPHLAAVIHATDGADDGKRKLGSAIRRRARGQDNDRGNGPGDENTGKVPVIEQFTSAQLDLALGRLNVVHAALLGGPVSETFLARTARLERYRADQTGDDLQRKAPARAAEDERTR